MRLAIIRVVRVVPIAAIAAIAGIIAIAPISNGSTPDKVGALEESATGYLNEALAELLAVLSDTSASQAKQLMAVENIVRKRLDYGEFSRFALSHWKSPFSEEQRSRYECEFDAYLSNYIGSRLVRYHQEQVNVFRANALSNGDVILSTRISGGQYDQAVVTFLMRKSNPAPNTKSGEWRAIDVAFEGTKVRKLLQAQFQSVLEQGGPDELIAMLNEKTAGQSPCATQQRAE